MRSYVAGTDITIAVPLVWNGEPFLPDGGDVIWNVRDHAGVIAVPNTTMHGVTDSTALPVVVASVNALTGGVSLEKRTLTATGTKGGVPFVIVVPYRIHVFLNTTAQASDVRKFIGIDDGELPDDEVDLVSAYFDVADLTTEVLLVAALAGDDRQANRAIIAQAVILLLPSLQARISQSESDGTSQAQRFDLDFSVIETLARTQRDKATAIITGVLPAARAMTAPSTQADPVTGV